MAVSAKIEYGIDTDPFIYTPYHKNTPVILVRKPQLASYAEAMDDPYPVWRLRFEERDVDGPETTEWLVLDNRAKDILARVPGRSLERRDLVGNELFVNDFIVTMNSGKKSNILGVILKASPRQVTFLNLMESHSHDKGVPKHRPYSQVAKVDLVVS